jgi:hypothetical protein
MSMEVELKHTVTAACHSGHRECPCDTTGALVVALVEGRLSVTHRRTGRAVLGYIHFPPTPEGLAAAQRARDHLRVSGINWDAESAEEIAESMKPVRAVWESIRRDCHDWLDTNEPDDDDCNCSRSFDAEVIIAYDRGRTSPASAEIHDCIRKIGNKPHLAPLYIADLLRAKP